MFGWDPSETSKISRGLADAFQISRRIGKMYMLYFASACSCIQQGLHTQSLRCWASSNPDALETAPSNPLAAPQELRARVP